MQTKKRLAVLLSTALLATAMTGCTKAALTTEATAPANDSVVASYTQGSLSTAELSERLFSREGMRVMLDMVDKDILDVVQPVTDDMRKAMDQQLEQIKSYYKEDFEKNLKIGGYSSEDAFKMSLLLNEQRKLYTLTYIIENKLSSEEIQSYYDDFSPEIEASHILIKPEDESETSKTAALLQAKNLIKRINDGEDFAELAKEFSDDPGSGAKGGQLGSFGKGMMVEPFEKAAFALKIGEVTAEPVESPFGYHIIKKTGGEEKKPLKDMKAEIEQTLATQKLQSDESLSAEAFIKLRADNGFTIEHTQLDEQYELMTKQVNK